MGGRSPFASFWLVQFLILPDLQPWKTSSHTGVMKRCLFIALCRDSAQLDANGPHPAMLPLPVFPRQIASSDVNSSKNSSSGILGHLWLHCCEQVSILHLFCFARIDIYRLLFMSQNPRHSKIEYCISVKTIGMCFVHLLLSDLPASRSPS